MFGHKARMRRIIERERAAQLVVNSLFDSLLKVKETNKILDKGVKEIHEEK